MVFFTSEVLKLNQIGYLKTFLRAGPLIAVYCIVIERKLRTLTLLETGAVTTAGPNFCYFHHNLLRNRETVFTFQFLFLNVETDSEKKSYH